MQLGLKLLAECTYEPGQRRHVRLLLYCAQVLIAVAVLLLQYSCTHRTALLTAQASELLMPT